MLSIKEKIFQLENLKIVFSGDSQTWGQGARGWKEAMPDVRQGELRRLPKSVPTCASMLERHLTELRGADKETIVVNSGVGSTAVNNYYDNYFKSMVLDEKPDIVIMMHGINDWLSDRDVSLELFRKNLILMKEELKNIGASVVMMSQSPVMGNPFSGDHFYDDYINEFRKVSLSDPFIRFADANILFKKFLSDGDYDQNVKWLYEDNFHCTQLGQYIYLKACTEAMGI
jgi:GDSL-like Lipase/Acylhydrolase.